MASIVIFGDERWPAEGYWRVAVPMILFGVGYTVYSEWMNVEVRHAWAYSNLMPTLPLLGTGLSLLLQWVAIPIVALLAARHRTRGG